MRHFHQLSDAQRRRLFAIDPQPFARDAAVDTLAVALGATLYMPATRPALIADLLKQGAKGVLSSVICLEDAVPDAELERAEANVIEQLRAASEEPGLEDRLPLTFVRVRDPAQITHLVDGLGDRAGLLSG